MMMLCWLLSHVGPGPRPGRHHRHLAAFYRALEAEAFSRLCCTWGWGLEIPPPVAWRCLSPVGAPGSHSQPHCRDAAASPCPECPAFASLSWTLTGLEQPPRWRLSEAQASGLAAATGAGDSSPDQPQTG